MVRSEHGRSPKESPSPIEYSDEELQVINNDLVQKYLGLMVHSPKYKDTLARDSLGLGKKDSDEPEVKGPIAVPQVIFQKGQNYKWRAKYSCLNEYHDLRLERRTGSKKMGYTYESFQLFSPVDMESGSWSPSTIVYIKSRTDAQGEQSVEPPERNNSLAVQRAHAILNSYAKELARSDRTP